MHIRILWGAFKGNHCLEPIPDQLKVWPSTNWAIRAPFHSRPIKSDLGIKPGIRVFIKPSRGFSYAARIENHWESFPQSTQLVVVWTISGGKTLSASQDRWLHSLKKKKSISLKASNICLCNFYSLILVLLFEDTYLRWNPFLHILVRVHISRERYLFPSIPFNFAFLCRQVLCSLGLLC